MTIDDEIKTHQKLVYYTINKYFPDLIDDEDIVQEGLIALWKAIINKPNDKVFPSYAVKTIKNGILTEIRKRNAKKRALGNEYKVIYLDDENTDELTGFETIPYRLIELEDYKENTDEIKREILKYITIGYNLKEISERLKMPYQAIYKIWYQIKEDFEGE